MLRLLACPSRRSQIATLNFLDAFLRTRSHVVAPSDAFTAVELWMGIVHVYTCRDSLSTCQVRVVSPHVGIELGA